MFFRSKCISTIFWSRKKKSHCLFRFPIFLELRDASSVYCVSSGVIYVGKPHKRWMPSLWVFYLMFIYIDFVYRAEQKLGEMGYLLCWNVFHLFGSYSISQLVSPSNFMHVNLLKWFPTKILVVMLIVICQLRTYIWSWYKNQ